ncbi:MAG: homoserine kinase [Sporichthyaceae bacterium]
MPAFLDTPVTVTVPATSANLGPGFDSFGLALGLYDEVTLTAIDSGLQIEVEGEGAATATRGERHLVVRALRAALDALGGQPAGLRVQCRNRIPHGRGLGSSSAAIVAGITAARALCPGRAELLDPAASLRLATEIEGHPDNVAAALQGGFTIAWTQADGPRVLRLEPAPDLLLVVFVPPTELSTRRARALLPATVPHADAAANTARAALLVHALTTRPDLLMVATEDRLHQDYRGPAMPESLALVRALRAGGVPATISGAGPSVLALAAPDTVLTASAIAGGSWQVYRLPVDAAGACVLPS